MPHLGNEMLGDFGALVRALGAADRDPDAKVVEDGGTAPHRFAACEATVGGRSFRAMLVEEDGWKIARVTAADAAAKGEPAAPAVKPTKEVTIHVEEAAESVLKAIDAHDTKAFLALAAPTLVPAPVQMGEDPGEALVARLHEKYGQRPHRFGAMSVRSGGGKARPVVQVLFGDKEDLAEFAFLVDLDTGKVLLESVTALDVNDFVPR